MLDYSGCRGVDASDSRPSMGVGGRSRPALAPLKLGSRKVCVGNWHPQDFQHFMRYLNETQWDKQVGGATDDFGALQCLFMYLKDMGLPERSDVCSDHGIQSFGPRRDRGNESRSV